jgi:cytochrome c
MRRLFVVLVVLSVGVGTALAHEAQIVDLKNAPPDHQVKAVGYCKGEYQVALKDGSTRQFKEFDLRLKTDSGPTGPKPGAPALIKAGMAGDRAFLVFSEPGEMKDFVKKTC